MNPIGQNLGMDGVFGSNVFRDSLLGRLDALRSKCKRSNFNGPEIQMHNGRRALRFLSAGLKQLGLTNKTLKSLQKGAPEKKALI